jgi:hypothetical protein
MKNSGKGEGDYIGMVFKQGGQEFRLLIPAECKDCVLQGVAAPAEKPVKPSNKGVNGITNKFQLFSERDLKSK